MICQKKKKKSCRRYLNKNVDGSGRFNTGNMEIADGPAGGEWQEDPVLLYNSERACCRRGGIFISSRKKKSGSIVRYSKNKTEKPDEDQLLEDRLASYRRSKNDVERIEKALEKIKDRKGYEVI